MKMLESKLGQKHQKKNIKVFKISTETLIEQISTVLTLIVN